MFVVINTMFVVINTMFVVINTMFIVIRFFSSSGSVLLVVLSWDA